MKASLHVALYRACYPTDRASLEQDCLLERVEVTCGRKPRVGVRLEHPSSGITIVMTRRRSLARNRALAFEQLVERLESLNERAALGGGGQQ